MRLSQLDWLSGEETSRSSPSPLRVEPPTSVLPRGTTTNQHFRGVVVCPVVTESPQPRPADWRTVWTSKSSRPVPSPCVRANGISLVTWESKKSLRLDVAGSVGLSLPTAQNGTKTLLTLPAVCFKPSLGSVRLPP